MVRSWCFRFTLLVFAAFAALKLLKFKGFKVERNSLENERVTIDLTATSNDDDDYLPLPVVLKRNITKLVKYHNPKFRFNEVDPVVSIVTSVFSFNENELQETVASIQHQSLQNWEWIIADDAMIENVHLRVFVEDLRDKRIRIVRSDRRGAVETRNFAISVSKGKYFYTLDDDDLIGHHTLELLYFSLECNPEASFANGFSYGFGYKSFAWSKSYGRPEDFILENSGTYALMVRKEHWLAVGGYDSMRHGGMENYDFALKLMNQMKWGYTVPEYMLWYRTSIANQDIRWSESLSLDELKHFMKNIPTIYPNIGANKYPKIPCPSYIPYQHADTSIALSNGVTLTPLPKTKQRLLFILPRFSIDGANKMNLNFVRGIVNVGWEVTIVVVHSVKTSSRDHFAEYTSDIFVLSNFLPTAAFPRFLRHLLYSRSPDVVMTSNTFVGYNLIPLLAMSFPQSVFVDLVHDEHFSFSSEKWTHVARGISPWYDFNFVSTFALRDWMIESGVLDENLKVCAHRCCVCARIFIVLRLVGRCCEWEYSKKITNAMNLQDICLERN